VIVCGNLGDCLDGSDGDDLLGGTGEIELMQVGSSTWSLWGYLGLP